MEQLVGNSLAARMREDASPIGDGWDIANLDTWLWYGGALVDDTFHLNLSTGPASGVIFGVSPQFSLKPGQPVSIQIECDIAEAARFEVELCQDQASASEQPSLQHVARRQVLAADRTCAVVAFAPLADATYRLRLYLLLDTSCWPQKAKVRFRRIALRTYGAAPDRVAADTATHLPHWSRLERAIHDRCRRSRQFNGLVSAIETRMGREELLSLPQYMSLCPTGQCNATCAFCSVTVNRTGIIKRQLPFESIRRFTAPAANTVRMYGLEGNGEPTLYRDFEGLVAHVLGNGAIGYLITNASQLSREMIPLLLGLNSINVSLNAATAATHRRVMGLKTFAAIADGIRELMRHRGPGNQQPQVSVSFVVTRDNIFEAVDFLRFAELDLGVDRILLRPLSELGNDGGSVEDFRDLVPYQSEVDDLIEGIDDYLASTKNLRRAEIVFDRGSFKAVRPDPPGTAILPLDRPNELPVPRRSAWRVPEGTDIVWHNGSRLTARGGPAAQARTFLRSGPIPVPPARDLTLSLEVAGLAHDLEVCVLDHAGATIARQQVRAEADVGASSVKLPVATGATPAVSIELRHGPAPFAVDIDLGRVRKPGPIVDPHPAVPGPTRWTKDTSDASISWNSNIQSISWSGAPHRYLTKSYSRPCLPGVIIRYPVRITVRSGALGIGVLCEDFRSWLRTFKFEAGRHDTVLEFEVGANTRLQLVLYACEGGPLDAEIDWSEAMRQRAFSAADLAQLAVANKAALALRPPEGTPGSAPPTVEARRQAVREARAEYGAPIAIPAPSSVDGEVVGASHEGQANKPNRGGSVWRLLWGRRPMYCHKPWTDLHNFTVDGRMDVCCIATGASQTRFALGNMGSQSFQAVWNGARAREFRRTVNDPARALPPCQRCPMSHAYAGPLFSPDATFFSVWSRFERLPLHRTRAGRYVLFAAFLAFYGPLHLWLFRGFKRARLFPSFARLRRAP